MVGAHDTSPHRRTGRRRGRHGSGMDERSDESAGRRGLRGPGPLDRDRACAARAWRSTSSSTAPTPSTHLAVTRYDVVVLDRDLPGVHGDEVCRQIVAERSDCRVLMLTAASTVKDRVDGLGLGADDYLPKPFDFSELVARVRALGRRSTPAPRRRPSRLRRPHARPEPPRRVPGRTAPGAQPQGVRRARMPPRLAATGSSPPRSCSNGSGTRPPTRSPPRSRRPCAGCGPSSATRPSSRPSARAATGSEDSR